MTPGGRLRRLAWLAVFAAGDGPWLRRAGWTLAGLVVAIGVCGAIGNSLLGVESDWYGTRRYDPLIRQAARRHFPAEWDWQLLKALVRQESRFDPEARSGPGAIGLAQVMPATGRDLGLSPEELQKPAANLEAAATYLRWLYRQWYLLPDMGRSRLRTRFVLASYNAGLGTVRKAWREAGYPRAWEPVRDRLPAETQAYVAAILEEHLPVFEAGNQGQLLGFRSYEAYLRTQR